MNKQILLDLGFVVDNEYLDKYVELINCNKFTKKERFITQEHHIIPKYFYLYNDRDIDNSKENKVHLKFSDHLLAHYYLMKCSSTTKYELANANAIIKTKSNPHSVDFDHWIEENETLLQDINHRRCELASLHHHNVSNGKNPRAAKVYQYDLTTLELQFVFGSKKEALEKYSLTNVDGKFSTFGGVILFDENIILLRNETLDENKLKNILNKYEEKTEEQKK